MRGELFDAIVVGAGMAGATAALQLCRAGLKVLVVEARSALQNPNESVNQKEQGVQRQCYAFSDRTHAYFINDTLHPYLTTPDQPFSWIRAGVVGGRSHLWAGHCYRMGNREFRSGEIDGSGPGWPLTYEELEPYYDLAEKLLNVRQASPAVIALEARLRVSFANLHEALLPARLSARPSFPESNLQCLHCGRIDDECVRPVTANLWLTDAHKSGHLTLWTDFPVERVSVNARGRAAGVSGRNRANGETVVARAHVIFLCASTLESTRILLNSVSPAFPDGLGNSSGVVGHYLMDHISLEGRAMWEGAGGDLRENSRAEMFYLPVRGGHTGQIDGQFARDYGYQVFVVRADHELLPCGRTQRAAKIESPGQKDDCVIRLAGFGEMLPQHGNHVKIDPGGNKDGDGIPILRIDCSHQENDRTLAENMARFCRDLFSALNASTRELQTVPREPGLAIHEAGTCRMGSDPRTSALNAFNQSHDVPNLFVTDGGCFPSIGIQNPALTIVALTLRACDYAIEQLRRGEI